MTPASFLRALFGSMPAEGRIEIRSMVDHPNQSGAQSAWFTLDSLIHNLNTLYVNGIDSGAAIYYGVLPRTQGGATAQECLPSRVLWVDADFKDSSEEAVWQRVADLKPMPSIIVASGLGLHLYWLLENAQAPGTLQIYNSRLSAAFAPGGADCGDAPRILRLPGSAHLKRSWALVENGAGSKWTYTKPQTGQEIRSSIMFPDEGSDIVRYGLGDFQHLPPAPERVDVEYVAHDRKLAEISDVMPPEVLALLEKDEWLVKLWCSEGLEDREDHSNSIYNVTFASALVRYGITDPDVLDAAVNARPRTDNQPHAQRAVYRAVDSALGYVENQGEVGISDVSLAERLLAAWKKLNKEKPSINTGDTEHPSGPDAPEDGEASTEEEPPIPKSQEQLDFERQDRRVKRMEEILAEYEAKLPAAKLVLASANSVRSRIRVLNIERKRLQEKGPSEGEQQADPVLLAAKTAYRTIEHAFDEAPEADKAAIRGALSTAVSNRDAAYASLHARLVQSIDDKIEAEEKSLSDARKFISDVKEGHAQLKEARKLRSALRRIMAAIGAGFAREPSVVLATNNIMEPHGGCDNVLRIFEGDPHFNNYFALDEFSGRTLHNGKVVTDNMEALLAAMIARVYEINNVPKGNVHDMAEVMAERNVFNSVQRYLESSKWDGVERLKNLLKIGFGCETPEGEDGEALLQSMSKKWLVGCVARAMKPGCKQDNAVVLTGSEGSYKSSGIELLFTPPCVDKAYPWFASTSAKLGSKEMMEICLGKWCVELNEMAGFTSVQLDLVKGDLATGVNNFRPAYGRHAVAHLRTHCYVGTTNEPKFLDPTEEGRRFVCAKVIKVCLDWIRENREQLWAEALHMYHLSGGADACYWYADEDKRRLAKNNDSFKIEDPRQEKITKLIQDKKKAGAVHATALQLVQAGIAASQDVDAFAHSLINCQGIVNSALVMQLIKSTLDEKGFPRDMKALEEKLHWAGLKLRAFSISDAFSETYLNLPAGRVGKSDMNAVGKLFRVLGCIPYFPKGSVAKTHSRQCILGDERIWFLPPENLKI